MKSDSTNRYKSLGRSVRIGAMMLMSVLMLALASCSSRRAGITHNYSTPYGNGTLYFEGSDHGGPGPKHKKPKKPKKPKHKKEKHDKKHHGHHD